MTHCQRQLRMTLYEGLASLTAHHDAQVFVTNFQAPAPPTQAGFFFFGTELLNPCMWSTDSDFMQAPYFPGNGSDAAQCPGCKVQYCRPHRGHILQVMVTDCWNTSR